MILNQLLLENIIKLHMEMEKSIIQNKVDIIILKSRLLYLLLLYFKVDNCYIMIFKITFSSIHNITISKILFELPST